MQMCIYVEGQGNIVDIINEDGLATYSRKPQDELLKEYPNAKVIPFDDAVDLIDAVNVETYKVGKLTEITQERWDEMLNVLPPMHWTGGGGTDIKAGAPACRLWEADE